MKTKDKTLFKGDETVTPAAATAATETPVVTTEKTETTPVPTEVVAKSQEAAPKGSFQEMAEQTLSAIPVSKALVIEQKGMFMAMSDALMSVAMTLDMIRMDLMSFMASDGKTGFMGEEVVKSLKLAEPTLSDDELTEKAGRKMKKDRLVKLKEAMGIIGNLIKELDDEMEVNKGGQTMTAKKQDQETQKSTDGSVASASADTAATQAAATTEAKGETVSLTKEELNTLVETAVTKAVEPLKKEIEALKSAPAESASEGAGSVEETEVSKSKQQSLFKGLIR